MTDALYAPVTPEHVIRAATLTAARHFGTEAVTVRCIAADTDDVIAYRIDGRHPQGWDLLGESIVVHPDGTIDADA